MQDWLDGLKRQFTLNFIADDRWRFLWNGLGVTLRVTFCALLIGVAVGICVSIVRSTYDKGILTNKNGLGYSVLWLLNKICKIYLTVIRGTPVVVQLMIFYFIILTSIKSGVLIAIIAFGFNTGAYIAEIFRSGIMSIESGQFEAGRSLGFNYIQTMRYIVIPQAFRNILPTLANEFIVLLKETAVVGYVAVQDLTKGGDIIRGRTFSPFMPLFAVALVYLTLVLFFTRLVGRLERRLRRSEH